MVVAASLDDRQSTRAKDQHFQSSRRFPNTVSLSLVIVERKLSGQERDPTVEKGTWTPGGALTTSSPVASPLAFTHEMFVCNQSHDLFPSSHS
jgi:hypothetical protein